jgi:hypothetical protein
MLTQQDQANTCAVTPSVTHRGSPDIAHAVQRPAARSAVLAARQRTAGAALAAAAWAATWAVIAGGHLGRGAAVEIAFAASMGTLALGETLLSPPPPEAVTDPAPSGSADRYNRLGILAFTVGLLLGSAAGGAALGADWRTSLITSFALACAAASIALRRRGRYHRKSSHVPAPAGAKVRHVPRKWLQRHPGCYGVVWHDPDGHSVEVGYHG